MEYFNQFLNAFAALGVYAYVVAAIFVFAAIYGIFSVRYHSNAKKKWLDAHQGAVKVSLDNGTNLITQKSMQVNVVSGEAAVFFDKGFYTVYSMPGDIVLDVTYIYTRPGVLHKNVTTTWGPAKVELHLEAEKEYKLKFDRKQENFFLEEK